MRHYVQWIILVAAFTINFTCINGDFDMFGTIYEPIKEKERYDRYKEFAMARVSEKIAAGDTGFSERYKGTNLKVVRVAEGSCRFYVSVMVVIEASVKKEESTHPCIGVLVNIEATRSEILPNKFEILPLTKVKSKEEVDHFTKKFLDILGKHKINVDKQIISVYQPLTCGSTVNTMYVVTATYPIGKNGKKKSYGGAYFYPNGTAIPFMTTIEKKSVKIDDRFCFENGL